MSRESMRIDCTEVKIVKCFHRTRRKGVAWRLPPPAPPPCSKPRPHQTHGPILESLHLQHIQSAVVV